MLYIDYDNFSYLDQNSDYVENIKENKAFAPEEKKIMLQFP